MEEQNNLNQLPKTRRIHGQVQTSVLISQNFYNLCKQHHIKFSEATRVGISLLLADKGVIEYDNNLNLKRKLDQLRLQLERTSQEFYELKDKVQNKDAQNFSK